ncbi:antiviral reverse transcriptase Drt2 [Chitinophaga lutea]
MNNQIYWDSFVKKELTFYSTTGHLYLKKGYLHFDDRIWFPDFQRSFKRYILKPENITTHSFFPFLKVVLKTKRLKNNKKRHKRKVEIKERPICYAAHFDALIYSFYSTVLSEKYEAFVLKKNITDCTLAYRPLGLSNIDFAEEVFQYIEKTGECAAIALDIKGFFDSLDHMQLKEKWLEVLNTGEPLTLSRLPDDHFKVYNSLTRYSFVEKSDLLKCLSIKENKISKLKLSRYCSIDDFRLKVKKATPSPLHINDLTYGIPQGSPISAILSNIYMVDYDIKISQFAQKHNFLYRRYCDDIIFICQNDDLAAVKTLLYDEIGKLKLTIQPEKEEVVYFKLDNGSLRGYKDISSTEFKNLQYLGFEFNGRHRYIRPSSMSKYYRRMKAGVRETVKRAYGKHSKEGQVFKYKLFDRFTHLGGKNFLSYAYRASKKMNSVQIRNQVSRHFQVLKETVNEKSTKLVMRLNKKGVKMALKK